MSATNLTTNFSEWNPAAIKYTVPKANKVGGKAITIINPSTNRSLHITTPPMMTWGIADFVDQNTQESDGKYTISLNFPNPEYANFDTDLFLKKMKDFEAQVIDDAVKNSESWWGESMSKEILKHTFFPFLKYQKDKLTKKIDLSKPPSIRAKVTSYEGKWPNLEIYDTRSQLLFPCENPMTTPMDFVPKLSQVMCLLQCGGIWIGGKGWGITWKLVQCVVKPRENVSVLGKCRIPLSMDVREMLESQSVDDDSASENVYEQAKRVAEETSQKAVVETVVEDSDNEAEPEPQTQLQPEAEPEPESVAESTPQLDEPVVEKKAPIFKKPVTRKTNVDDELSTPPEIRNTPPAIPVVKRVIKKKV